MSQSKKNIVIIAGAGGIAKAAALILAEWSKIKPEIYIGNRTLKKAQQVAAWVKAGSTKPIVVEGFYLGPESLTFETKVLFKEAKILLDCLPGSLAPRMAKLAKDNGLHYANLTEYVNETNQIIDLAKDAQTGFVLQTGLAPGYIDVLAHKLFLDFCKDFKVDKVDKLELKVGALTDHAVAPHYYGFTWSPIGVATEYIKDCVVIRDYKKTQLPALSERATILINGIAYEDDLTSGGAADLPDALADKVKTLDYKTLRHPGHYGWVAEQLKKLPKTAETIDKLEATMLKEIPHVEDDQIIVYAAVQGLDFKGTLRRREVAKQIKPIKVGKHTLRAIQTTTAVPLLQSMQMLLDKNPKGLILQSQIEPETFLNGDFVKRVYGEV